MADNVRWMIVDVAGRSVFEFANSSKLEDDANLHVSETGWVSTTGEVKAGEELLWWYGDAFCL